MSSKEKERHAILKEEIKRDRVEKSEMRRESGDIQRNRSMGVTVYRSMYTYPISYCLYYIALL